MGDWLKRMETEYSQTTGAMTEIDKAAVSITGRVSESKTISYTQTPHILDASRHYFVPSLERVAQIPFITDLGPRKHLTILVNFEHCNTDLAVKLEDITEFFGSAYDERLRIVCVVKLAVFMMLLCIFLTFLFL